MKKLGTTVCPSDSARRKRKRGDSSERAEAGSSEKLDGCGLRRSKRTEGAGVTCNLSAGNDSCVALMGSRGGSNEELGPVPLRSSVDEDPDPPQMDSLSRADGCGVGNEPVGMQLSSSATPPRTTLLQRRQDVIYRIMHATPRTDELEVIGCRFGKAECERALQYFDETYMSHALRRLRFQIGCSFDCGLGPFFTRIAFHWQALRLLDLSRNAMTADDAVVLCRGLRLRDENKTLEVLDLSYNRQLGNSGALHLFEVLSKNTTLRALILKSVSIDDDGAVGLWQYLTRRPHPSASQRLSMTSCTQHLRQMFFVNLNENCVGARGTALLGKQLPPYVSVSLVKQRVRRGAK